MSRIFLVARPTSQPSATARDIGDMVAIVMEYREEGSEKGCYFGRLPKLTIEVQCTRLEIGRNLFTCFHISLYELAPLYGGSTNERKQHSIEQIRFICTTPTHTIRHSIDK